MPKGVYKRAKTPRSKTSAREPAPYRSPKQTLDDAIHEVIRSRLPDMLREAIDRGTIHFRCTATVRPKK